ncbi:hypothetical protein AURDEDRAFT_166679 [Auricularia subglabra TFB-10046 SS5]|nr:hypothetical protein AURDEDRAFT_166679 [Auricularia subglabra TFB-10046 SS5]
MVAELLKIAVCGIDRRTGNTSEPPGERHGLVTRPPSLEDAARTSEIIQHAAPVSDDFTVPDAARVAFPATGTVDTFPADTPLSTSASARAGPTRHLRALSASRSSLPGAAEALPVSALPGSRGGTQERERPDITIEARADDATPEMLVPAGDSAQTPGYAHERREQGPPRTIQTPSRAKGDRSGDGADELAVGQLGDQPESKPGAPGGSAAVLEVQAGSHETNLGGDATHLGDRSDLCDPPPDPPAGPADTHIRIAGPDVHWSDETSPGSPRDPSVGAHAVQRVVQAGNDALGADDGPHTRRSRDSDIIRAEPPDAGIRVVRSEDPAIGCAEPQMPGSGSHIAPDGDTRVQGPDVDHGLGEGAHARPPASRSETSPATAGRSTKSHTALLPGEDVHAEETLRLGDAQSRFRAGAAVANDAMIGGDALTDASRPALQQGSPGGADDEYGARTRDSGAARRRAHEREAAQTHSPRGTRAAQLSGVAGIDDLKDFERDAAVDE